MFCPKCGEILRDGALRCPVCGAAQGKKDSRVNDPCDCGTNKRVRFQWGKTKTHSTYAPDRRPASGSGPRGEPSLGEFVGLIKDFFRRGLDFKGRSSRWEFWWTYLFVFLVTVLLLDTVRLMLLWLAVMIVPFTALGVRRLHDIGGSGWWLLLKAIPLVGVVLLIVLFCQPSRP